MQNMMKNLFFLHGDLSKVTLLAPGRRYNLKIKYVPGRRHALHVLPSARLPVVEEGLVRQGIAARHEDRFTVNDSQTLAVQCDGERS